MSYLDELADLFRDIEMGGGEGRGTVTGETPIQAARRQLDAAHPRYHEEKEGVFRICGNRHGCGFAEGVIVVDEATGMATLDVNANQRLRLQDIPAARKLFRRLNSTFIVPGLMVDDEGWIHFHPRDLDLNAGNDLADCMGKALSTIHAHANVAVQFAAGRSAWEILKTLEADD